MHLRKITVEFKILLSTCFLQVEIYVNTFVNHQFLRRRKKMLKSNKVRKSIALAKKLASQFLLIYHYVSQNFLPRMVQMPSLLRYLLRLLNQWLLSSSLMLCVAMEWLNGKHHVQLLPERVLNVMQNVRLPKLLSQRESLVAFNSNPVDVLFANYERINAPFQYHNRVNRHSCPEKEQKCWTT